MKNIFKKKLIDVFSECMMHHETRRIVKGFIRSGNTKLPRLNNIPNPYRTHFKPKEKSSRLRSDTVFITGRFRSGSTALWNLFRQVDKCTSYYEPFNERQWFSAVTRGSDVDRTHLGVDDYWNEYNGLEDLSNYYSEDWTRFDLCMDGNAYNPQMLRYIEEIIKATKNSPVLQFNRIDFRLEWIKAHFPNAKIIHLYRHPRDQWLSFLTDKKLMNCDELLHSYIDSFYLNSWCLDLSVLFPFLDIKETPHPYRRFYYLWKLSLIFGMKYSDCSLDYESLAENPDVGIAKIFDVLDWDLNPSEYSHVFKRPILNKWKSYASDEWFMDHELHCEGILTDYFGI
ncbi:MAG: hypothetical protein ACJA0H_001569 [Francisellaceae bacterium]|jgi:hypothetical protein